MAELIGYSALMFVGGVIAIYIINNFFDWFGDTKIGGIIATILGVLVFIAIIAMFFVS